MSAASSDRAGWTKLAAARDSVPAVSTTSAFAIVAWPSPTAESRSPEMSRPAAVPAATVGAAHFSFAMVSTNVGWSGT